MTRMVPIITLALLAGCATTYSRGRKLAEQGRFEEASRYWMAALDEDEEARGPRKGLDQYGSSAVWVYLETAEEHEVEQRYADAIEAYGRALVLADELVAYDVDPGLDREELGRSVVDVQDALSRYRYQQGLAAMERHEWADAIHWFEQSRAFHPDYEDTGELIGSAHRMAGHDALQDAQYVRALTEFASAMVWTDDAEARAWHDVTAVALGRHYLGQGACRSAWTLFDAVRSTTRDPAIEESLAMAEDCARVEVVIHPFESSPSLADGSIDLTGVAADAVTEAIRASGSDFLRLVDPALAEEVPNTFGHRYTVRGRVSQFLTENPEPVVRTLSVTGTHHIPCPMPDGYTDYAGEICDETVPLTAEQRTARSMVGVLGSVRVSDPRTGELMITKSLDGRYEQEVTSRTVFRSQTSPVRVGPTASADVYQVDSAMLSIPLETAPLVQGPAAVERAMEAFAEQAALTVLAAVDREPEPIAPQRLDIREPLTDATQIEFQQADDVDDAPPTRVIIRGGP